MAKLEDIIKQLQAILPKYTDYFNEIVTPINITNPSGTIFEIETNVAHGLSTNDYVNVENILSQNQVTAITDLGSNQIKMETTVSHDLTENFNILEQKNHTVQIYLSGFTNLTDGFYDLLSVPLSTDFIVSLPSLPSGSGYLNEDRIDGIGGRYQVTVVDTTKFRIDVPNATFTDFLIITGSQIIINIRITAEGTPERFIAYYSKQKGLNDFWIFIDNGETTASFNRHIESNANQRFNKSDQILYELNQDFFVYVLAPQTNKFGARFISDLMVEIRKYLCKSLVGVSFPSGFDSEEEGFVTTFLSDGFFDYAGAYYVHQFVFQTVYNFNSGDAVDVLDTRAFREFEINFKLASNGFSEVKKQVAGVLP